MKIIETTFWKIAKYIIIKGYGANCLDYEKECISCQVKEVIEFIDQHIKLINL